MSAINKAAANALPEGFTNPLIARAKTGQLPDALPLWDIAELLFEHRRVPGTFYGIFEGINFTSFVHQQVMRNLVKVQGYTNKEMSGPGVPKGTKEPIIHRDEIKICLELAGAWPIDEDGCLLANWWKEATPEPRTNKPQNPDDITTRRNNDFQAWINETKPDLDAMTWKEIHEALKARDRALWISDSAFDDWRKKQKIHKKKQTGRPPKRR